MAVGAGGNELPALLGDGLGLANLAGAPDTKALPWEVDDLELLGTPGHTEVGVVPQCPQCALNQPGRVLVHLCGARDQHDFVGDGVPAGVVHLELITGTCSNGLPVRVER